MITVKELITQLQTMDDDAVVIMSSDPEGNSYSPLADNVEGCAYDVTQHETYLLPCQLTDESREFGWSEEDVRDPTKNGDQFVNAICLSPKH